MRLTSRVALLQQAEEDAPAFMRGRLISFLSENTAEITVEYADYVVARGFLEAFDEWIRGCKCIPKRRGLQTLRRISHFVPHTLRLLMALAITWFALDAIPTYVKVASTMEAWARFFVVYSGASFVLLSLVRSAGEMIEEAIDTFPTLSYLKLNKGDSKMIDEFQGRRNGAIFKFIGGAVVSVALAILASKLEKLL